MRFASGLVPAFMLLGMGFAHALANPAVFRAMKKQPGVSR